MRDESRSAVDLRLKAERYKCAELLILRREKTYKRQIVAHTRQTNDDDYLHLNAIVEIDRSLIACP